MDCDGQQSEVDFLRAMARRYVWDQTPDEALARPDRIVRRVLDLGTWEDTSTLEAIFGHSRLAVILSASPPGALRPRSWWYWHYRLGLTVPAKSPPPMPTRSYG